MTSCDARTMFFYCLFLRYVVDWNMCSLIFFKFINCNFVAFVHLVDLQYNMMVWGNHMFFYQKGNYMCDIYESLLFFLAESRYIFGFVVPWISSLIFHLFACYFVISVCESFKMSPEDMKQLVCVLNLFYQK